MVEANKKMGARRGKKKKKMAERAYPGARLAKYPRPCVILQHKGFVLAATYAQHGLVNNTRGKIF